MTREAASKAAAQMPHRPVIGRGLSSPYAPLPPNDFLSLVVGILFQIYTIFIEPILCHLRLTRPGASDPTYGRSSIPPNAFERQYVFDNPNVQYRTGKAYVSKQALSKGDSSEREGEVFIAYTIFWVPEAIAKCGFKADVLLLHGINDHGGKLAPHGYRFAQAGFRVILVDLPTFGGSSGLHAYLPSMRMLIEAVHAVLFDVRHHDLREKEGGHFLVTDTRRKLFLEGHSMGGFTALYYAALYPPATEEEIKAGGLQGDKWRPHIDGVAVAAPMIGISPESRPGYAVEVFAKTMRFLLGRLPVASAVRGKVSDDERVETEFHLDPMTYKGRLRIATGLAILEGLQDLQEKAEQIKCPVQFHHGDRDRATSWRDSKAFFDRLPNQDKEYKLWSGYEHVMMKNVKGQSEEDDKKRDDVLQSITDWLVRQAKKD